ncbi:hypothetical protein EU545_04085 [Candidatus Thorarchaeota archaeon]|nr:MAG: hypothetical protein EU545_04085 [Candidatus Thorarchaeota archaeon]
MVRAYLSGPIIHEHLQKRDFYTTVVEVLKERGIEVFAPQFLVPAEAREIFLRDVKWVRQSDFLIGEVSNPSLGVGMEIMLAVELKKPVLLFRQTDSGRLSRMVLGATGKALFTYDEPSEVQSILRELALNQLILRECNHCESEVASNSGDGYVCVLCGESAD